MRSSKTVWYYVDSESSNFERYLVDKVNNTYWSFNSNPTSANFRKFIELVNENKEQILKLVKKIDDIYNDDFHLLVKNTSSLLDYVYIYFYLKEDVKESCKELMNEIKSAFELSNLYPQNEEVRGKLYSLIRSKKVEILKIQKDIENFIIASNNQLF